MVLPRYPVLFDIHCQQWLAIARFKEGRQKQKKNDAVEAIGVDRDGRKRDVIWLVQLLLVIPQFLIFVTVR